MIHIFSSITIPISFYVFLKLTLDKTKDINKDLRDYVHVHVQRVLSLIKSDIPF